MYIHVIHLLQVHCVTLLYTLLQLSSSFLFSDACLRCQTEGKQEECVGMKHSHVHVIDPCGFTQLFVSASMKFVRLKCCFIQGQSKPRMRTP